MQLRVARALTGLIAFYAVCCAAETAQFSDLQAKADQARAANRLDEAASLYRQAVALRPDWAEGWWNIGTLAYDRDDYVHAAAALKKAVALSPHAGIGFAMLGLSEAKLGRDREALAHIETGRKLGMGEDAGLRRVALYTEGVLLLRRGEFGRAQETLGALARDGVENDELLLALGQSVIGMRPAEVAPADAATRALLRRAGEAERLAARSELPEAASAYAGLAKEYAKVRNVQFAYGRFLVSNHEDDSAVAAFKREIENTPSHLLARLGIAGLALVHDPPVGIPYAEQAVKLAPRLGEAHYLLGALLLAGGDRNRAIAELETAKALSPGEAKIHLALARAFTAAGRSRDAARARTEFKRLNENENR